jgi:hypothetical protein
MTKLKTPSPVMGTSFQRRFLKLASRHKSRTSEESSTFQISEGTSPEAIEGKHKIPGRQTSIASPYEGKQQRQCNSSRHPMLFFPVGGKTQLFSEIRNLSVRNAIAETLIMQHGRA